MVLLPGLSIPRNYAKRVGGGVEEFKRSMELPVSYRAEQNRKIASGFSERQKRWLENEYESRRFKSNVNRIILRKKWKH